MKVRAGWHAISSGTWRTSRWRHALPTAGLPAAEIRAVSIARRCCVAGAFVLLLTLAAIASTWQAIRATLAENRASEQRDIARRKELEAIRAREETSKAYEEVAVANQNLKRTTRDLHLALYVSDLNRAYKFWDEGNIERVEELLERHRPGETEEDLRGVEWHYLRRLATRFQAGRIADVHASISDLAISPDGRSLAASSGNGALTVWDADTGAVRLRIPDAVGRPPGVHGRWRDADFGS